MLALAEKPSVGILISGQGSNMLSILQDAERPDAPYTVRLVAADRSAPGLALAKARGVPTLLLDRKSPSFEEDLLQAVASCDLVVLAGFLSILPPKLVRAFKGRILNIHPSLLPAHGGRGMYGKKVHAAVLAQGDLISGCTVHWVEEGVDTGAILAKAKVLVLREDTPETLGARILPLEHWLLVAALRQIAEERMKR
ncbi:Phosphoribosylglycinamide formyltransferase [Clostridiaceae bacterium JG1575]|nr:Phosphoribosylglycinamide formyltransferase [Clostridiaceae bacterium JG1575]